MNQEEYYKLEEIHLWYKIPRECVYDIYQKFIDKKTDLNDEKRSKSIEQTVRYFRRYNEKTN